MQEQSSKLGVGLGLRKDFLDQISQGIPQEINWFEVAPENYTNRGGRAQFLFEEIAEQIPIIAHGLMLSIGSIDELNWEHLKSVKKFIRRHQIPWFSDHLCTSSYQNQYFHDLLPLPFTWEAVHHVSERARIVQDFLEVPFALENISFYLFPEKPEMTETQFLNEVIQRSGVQLMLDVNNIYVNSKNHAFDAFQFIDEVMDLPFLQIHIAGHDDSDPELIIDTHGADICPPVWDLLKYVAQKRALPPVLIERDHDIPPLDILLKEVKQAHKIYEASWKENVHGNKDEMTGGEYESQTNT